MANFFEQFAAPAEPKKSNFFSQFAAPEVSADAATAPAPDSGTSAMADVPASFGSGIVRGIAETATLPVTIGRLKDMGVAKLIGAIEPHWARLFGEEPMADDQRARMVDTLASSNENSLTQGQDILRAIMDDNLYAPRTTPGKYAETVGEFMAPGGVPSKATLAVPTAARKGVEYATDLMRNAVVPGMASEAAGQAAEGSDYEFAARLAGALAGNVSTGIVKAASAPESVLRRATGPADQIDWAKAVGLQQNSTGIKLTGPEAISQAQGGASALPDVQRVVEGSIDGNQRMSPFFNERPGQVNAAVGNVLDHIAPQSPRPYTLGPLASEAATKAVKDVEAQRTAAVAPLYKAADADNVPLEDMQSIMDEIGAAIAADKTGIMAKPLRDLQSKLTATPATETAAAVPITDLENLDRARKYFRDKMDLPQIGQDAITKEQNATVTSFLDRLNKAMEANSSAFVAGKDQYGQISRELVDPVSQGPLGKVAAANTTETAGNAILPQNPLVGSEAEINDAVKRLVMQDPVNTPSLARQNLADRFSKAATETQGGSTQFAGAKFHKDVAGNPQREKTLYSVLDALGSQDASAAMPELLDVLQATGRRRPIGSATEFNRSINTDLGTASPFARGFDLIKSLGASWLTNAGDGLKRASLRHSTGTLADMFTDPNSVELIQAALARGSKINLEEAVARSLAQGAITNQGSR